MAFKEESIMTIVTMSPATASGLPHALKTAQDAMQLPEVQEMLRRLSDYQLGIFMPHMHDEVGGAFRQLPEGMLQVESGLEVSFQAAEVIANQPSRFLPVAWTWQAGAPAPLAVCEMVNGQTADHKMKRAV